MNEGNRFCVVLAVCCTTCAALALPGGNGPDATHAWRIHDMHRPNPVKITADPGKAPSDATVLFDGTEQSLANWVNDKGAPAQWRISDGALESVKGKGSIRTKKSYGDCQLHLEWAAPSHVEGFGQGRGNSGVIFMGMYEIQVLDSYETDPSKTPNPNPNYADGQAGAVYSENPPIVNPSRAPGEWQTYDIVFHPPVWEGDTLKDRGSFTVFYNGVLVQDHFVLEGQTAPGTRFTYPKHPARLPLVLQDHHNPVRYRNIWIREVPSRIVNPSDIAALRQKTAASLFAKIDFNNRAGAICGILEVLSYDKEDKYVEKLTSLRDAYLADLAKQNADGVKARKGEILAIRNGLNELIGNNVCPASCPFRAALQKYIDQYQLDKK